MVDSEVEALAMGIAEYLKKELKTTIKLETIYKHILQYLDDLGDVQVTYTKNQMISDLIKIVKSGSSAPTQSLIQLLGYANVQSEFQINVIDYKDLPDEV